MFVAAVLGVLQMRPTIHQSCTDSTWRGYIGYRGAPDCRFGWPLPWIRGYCDLSGNQTH
jgi:hypothetical protein